MGVDAVAFVSMSAALALGEGLAAAVVAVMYAGGNVLEEFAVARAERDLKSLVDRTPRIAHRRSSGDVEDVPVDQVAIGYLLFVRRRGHSRGRRDHNLQCRDRGVRSHWRACSGSPPTGRSGAKRHHQRRRNVRTRHDGDRGPEHLCRHRAHATADVGIAMGARGANALSEAADVHNAQEEDIYEHAVAA
jgi:hypothetical protein